MSKSKGRPAKPVEPVKPEKSVRPRGRTTTASGSQAAQAFQGRQTFEGEQVTTARGLHDQSRRSADESPAPTRPAGQRLFDMPYSSQVPSPVRPDLGLTSLVARAGHNAGYDIDLTLLDAADHRMIRTGVLLAHRVLDGRGEWYLGAPDWVPLLPEELIVPMAQTELPDDLGELVRPFRRGAALTPVAALHCERREFALRIADGRTAALLRDDKVTVRRNGLITARYREVMMTPVGPGLNSVQADWLRQCLTSAGATELDRLPRLVRRLGAPATGPSDLPVPANPAGGTFGQFITQLLGAGARDLICGDLALIGGRRGAERNLLESVAILRSRLQGLREVLGVEWVTDAVDDLDWLVAPAEDPAPPVFGSGWPGQPPDSDDLAALGGPSTLVDTDERLPVHGCRARMQSPRYLSLLERLIAAARAPRAGVEASQPAVQAVEALYAATLSRFVRAADRLAVEGMAQTWDAAWTAAQEVTRSAVIRALVDRAQTEKDLERLQPGFDLLERAIDTDRESAGILQSVDALTPADAFEAGRRYEQGRECARRLRSDFVTRWAKIRRKLG